MIWKYLCAAGFRGRPCPGWTRRAALIASILAGLVLAGRCADEALSPGSDSSGLHEGGRAGLAPGEARRRIDALRQEIAHDDTLYFQRAAPEISDSDYDRLKRELSALEAAFPDLGGRGAAVPEIGDDRSGLFPVRRHRARMLSLDKAYSETELRAFLSRLTRRAGQAGSDFVVEPKIDGLAISVTYEHGRLMRAVSRGNGDEGDDLTANVLTIRSLPRELRATAPDGSANPIPDLVEIRGEIYLEFEEFERINRERESADEPVFANPRNLAAGTVRLLDPREVAERTLSVVFYSWGAWEPAAMQPATQHGFHEQVRRWGLPGLAEYRTVHGTEGVYAAVEAFRREREKLSYPVDGAVVKLDAVPLRSEFGESERAPRWALACKFVPASAEARVEAITIQVGRTGLLTPVAELAPVLLVGSIVTRATLHNGATIARLDVRVGDTVMLEKVGEIIPAVSGVVFSKRPSDSRPYAFPAVCPACSTAVVQLEGEVVVRCPNPACPTQVRQRLRHFASRSCVKIDGLGPATINALVAGGRVKNIADLYRLCPEDLVTPGLDRGKSAGNLLAAIERSKRAELWRFIYGLGIPRVGAATARDLALKFGTLEALAAARREDFAAASDGAGPRFGEATVSAVLAHFSAPQNRAIVADLAELGVRPAAPRRH